MSGHGSLSAASDPAMLLAEALHVLTAGGTAVEAGIAAISEGHPQWEGAFC